MQNANTKKLPGKPQGAGDYKSDSALKSGYLF